MAELVLQLKKINKYFGKNHVIKNVDLEFEKGHFITFLGPSGCGKTTLLRMIAGFYEPDDGEILLNDKNIERVPPYNRNTAMVFQEYALFPHMNVFENVSYGLRVKHKPAEEIKKRVAEALSLMQLSGMEKRFPNQMSGGQQQRVAVARALVMNPELLLLDEPLSNLDAKLRVEMRTAIREVQKQVGITTVYVTHDQEEALSISDRIAVMKKGEIQQTARPHTIYTRPYNVFVSTFIGHSNLFHGTIKRDANGKVVVFNDGYIMPMDNLSADAVAGMEVIVSVRPEEFSIQKDGVKCKIKNKVFLGKYNTYFLEFPENMLIPDQPSIEFSQDLGHAERLLDIDEEVVLRPNPAKVNIFTADGSRNLLKGVVLHE